MLPFVFSYKRPPVNHMNENYSPCNSFTLSIIVLISTYQQGDIVLIPLYLMCSVARYPKTNTTTIIPLTPITTSHHTKTPPISPFPIPYS